MSKKQDILDHILPHEKRKARLTPRKALFIREYMNDPRNATQAAIRAGYAPKNASVIACRLLKDSAVRSALAQHFIDQETLLSETLTEALVRLRSLVNGPKNETAIRAAKTLLHYTKIASEVLVLKIKQPEEEAPQDELMTPEELIEAHRKEIALLEALIKKSPQEAPASSAPPLPKNEGLAALH
jgi:phage terminase small subunit